MGRGNHIGFKMRADLTTNQMFEPMYGSIVLEMVSDAPAGEILGETTKEYTFEACGETLDMAQLQEIWEAKLEPVYPYRKAGHHRQPDRPRRTQDRCGKAQGHHPGVPRHQL